MVLKGKSSTLKKGKGKKASSKKPGSDYTALLWNTNNLLAAVGIRTKKVASIDELTRVASSMFVAIFEALFRIRLDGIVRSPHTKEHYEFNVQRVIDALGEQINMNLQHIAGRSIVQGDIRALSNLVHIFVHFCPGISDQNQISKKVGKPFHVPAPVLANDMDSISTKDSTFEPMTGANFEQELLTGADMQLSEKDTRKLLTKTRVQMNQFERIDSARRRREDAMRKKENRLHDENRRKAAVSTKMQHKRWLEDTKREGEAFGLRQSSEEHAMLRRIYKTLLAKLHSWRTATQVERKEKVQYMRNEARSHVEALQNLFEDRMVLLREQNDENAKDDAVRTRAQRLMGQDLLKSYNGRQKTLLEMHKSALFQKRQQQLLKRKESYRNLLAMLSVENWEESLRNSDLQI